MPDQARWSFSDDVETFAQRAWDLLAADPAVNTVSLTVVENVRAGRRWSEQPMLFGWCGEPAVAAVLLTPPYNLYLADVPEQLVGPLVSAVWARGVRPPGVTGESSLVDAFAASWTSASGSASHVEMRTRLYALDRLHAPDPLPPGRARRAEARDVALTPRWWAAFAAEAGALTAEPEAAVRDQIGDGRLWLWEDADGRPVSMAGRQRTAAGVARVGPVYTPPEHRRHGYGAAATAAVTEDALERGATDAVLFTDLANPTSNAIYQRLGFRPVRDQSVVRFGDA